MSAEPQTFDTVRDASAPESTGVDTPRTPTVLLWSTGLIVIALSAAAFLLWGRNGQAYMLDLIAAYCG